MDYEIDGDRYLCVSFGEIEEFLGREHMGAAADDDAIVAELLRLGAPEWVRTNEGFIDNDGNTAWWCIKGPSY